MPCILRSLPCFCGLYKATDPMCFCNYVLPLVPLSEVFTPTRHSCTLNIVLCLFHFVCVHSAYNNELLKLYPPVSLSWLCTAEVFRILVHLSFMLSANFVLSYWVMDCSVPKSRSLRSRGELRIQCWYLMSIMRMTLPGTWVTCYHQPSLVNNIEPIWSIHPFMYKLYGLNGKGLK